MELKKNPKADLNNYSGLYFVIGLTLVLFIVWRALEYKSYDPIREVVVSYSLEPDLNEEAPVTEIVNLPPPPAPPAAPVVIEVIDDTEEIEETMIQSTEISQDTKVADAVLSVEDIEVEEVEEDVSVPFAVIENVPVFPGCEDGTNEEKRLCFQRKVQEHVQKNFKYPPIAVEMGIQGKVYVQFVIDQKGYIRNIKTRGPNELLEVEATRIIAALPRMTPGMQRGRAVMVPYSIPVNFKLM